MPWNPTGYEVTIPRTYEIEYATVCSILLRHKDADASGGFRKIFAIKELREEFFFCHGVRLDLGEAKEIIEATIEHAHKWPPQDT